MIATVCFFAFRGPYSRIGPARLKAAGVVAEMIPLTGPPDGAECRVQDHQGLYPEVIGAS